jgi:hypothetical protein
MQTIVTHASEIYPTSEITTLMYLFVLFVCAYIQFFFKNRFILKSELSITLHHSAVRRLIIYCSSNVTDDKDQTYSCLHI